MRLTVKPYKSPCETYYIDNVPVDYLINDTNAARAMNKLGQLEDIEEDLGVDIETLWKALFNDGTFYFVAKTEIGDICCIKDNYYKVRILCDKSFEVYFQHECIAYCKFKDYGTTWSLRKEDLL